MFEPIINNLKVKINFVLYFVNFLSVYSYSYIEQSPSLIMEGYLLYINLFTFFYYCRKTIAIGL